MHFGVLNAAALWFASAAWETEICHVPAVPYRTAVGTGRYFHGPISIALVNLLLMSNAECLALLMGDDPPQEIENLLYRFLTSLFKRRLARRAPGILAAQGEGLSS